LLLKKKTRLHPMIPIQQVK